MQVFTSNKLHHFRFIYFFIAKIEADNLSCELCSFQFDKDIVYDIHRSFVHKIDKKQYNELKLPNINQEDNDLMEEGNNSITNGNSLEQSNDFDIKQGENEDSSQRNPYESDRKMPTQDTFDEKLKPHHCEMCDYS